MCMYALSNVYVYTPGLYSIHSTVYSIDDGVLYLFYPPISAATRPIFFARGLRHPLSRQEAFQQPEFWSPEKIPTRLNLSNLSRPDETSIS